MKEVLMAEVFVFIADYRDVGDALVDYCAVKNLYRRGAIDTYDAALVERDQDGTVHVNKGEKPTRKAAWTGAVVGAVVGVLFPPAILPMMAAGGVTGGLIGRRIRAGMSRGDLEELGETLDSGMAALVVVGKTSLADKVAKAVARAQATIEKQVTIDSKNLNKELAALTKAVA
jgi:uncharacterized membrane protein